MGDLQRSEAPCAAPPSLSLVVGGLSGLLAAIPLLLAGLFVTERVQAWREATQQRVISTAIATLGQALIELSLERSLVQVTLQLPDPLAPTHRAMIERQRTLAAEGFAGALGQFDGLGRGSAVSLAGYVRERLGRLEARRRAVDADLARPATVRDPEVLERWAAEVEGFLAALDRGEDRRRFERQASDLPARLSWPGGETAARVVSLSLGGAALDAGLPLPTGAEVVVSIAGGPGLPARIARAGAKSTAVMFAASEACQAELSRLLSRPAAAAA